MTTSCKKKRVLGTGATFQRADWVSQGGNESSLRLLDLIPAIIIITMQGRDREGIKKARERGDGGGEESKSFYAIKIYIAGSKQSLKRAHKNGQDKHLDFASSDLFFIYFHLFTFFLIARTHTIEFIAARL